MKREEKTIKAQQKSIKNENPNQTHMSEIRYAIAQRRVLVSILASISGRDESVEMIVFLERGEHAETGREAH